jgi:hypothetical protein
MTKEFNITGNCFASDHYMADVSKKIEQTLRMVEKGRYFIINRPRQYGKTTTLYTIADRLQEANYMVFNISFEGIGDEIFQNEEKFCIGFVELLAECTKNDSSNLYDWLYKISVEAKNVKALSSIITQLSNQTDKKIAVIIDEVDKSSNNQLFVSFLAMLRNKYLERKTTKTFHSVVLAGVHDVKSLKLKLRPEDEKKYNSPWNIAAEFTVDMNLQPDEIKPMLDDYVAERSVKMDTQEMSEQLFYYTSGYPFLVSKLCKMMDEKVMPTKKIAEWTTADLDKTVQVLIRETNTNFESVIKNLEDNPDLYQLVFRMLVEGEYQDYNIHDPIIHLGLLHGIFKNDSGIKIHNIIYEELIFHYMISKAKSNLILSDYNSGKKFHLPNNMLDMEAVLLKFQTFMREQYSKIDRDFLERHGRLVFLAFMKPILNGGGYDFKEVQISEERRLDVTITYYEHKYVAELKIWRGPKAHKEGLAQLVDYLDRLALDRGYLLIFDHSGVKEWTVKRIRTRGKKIFAVWV